MDPTRHSHIEGRNPDLSVKAVSRHDGGGVLTPTSLVNVLYCVYHAEESPYDAGLHPEVRACMHVEYLHR